MFDVINNVASKNPCTSIFMHTSDFLNIPRMEISGLKIHVLSRLLIHIYIVKTPGYI